MMHTEEKPLWNFPWKYGESFIITISLLTIGFIIEYFSPDAAVKIPAYPHNVIILISLVILIGFAQKFIKHPFIKWFSSIYAAISVISIFTLLILSMGFITQNPTPSKTTVWSQLGLTQIVGSVPYTLLSLLLIIILTFTTFRRLFPVNFRNLGFFLNHAGLLIVISAASFGVSDISRYYLSVKQGQTEWQALDKNGNVVEMPLAINLVDFTLEEYPPNLVLVDKTSGKIIRSGKDEKLPEIRTGMQCSLKNWDIEVLKYHPKAIMKDSGFIVAKDTMGAAAACLKIVNKETGEEKKAWICSEGIIQMPVPCDLDDKTQLYMASATAKKYKSKVKIYTKEQQIIDADIEVNKPLNVNGWEIYQYGYKSGMSDNDNISTFELVKDPWIKVVFTGIYIMIAGGFFMFWLGRKKEKA